MHLALSGDDALDGSSALTLSISTPAAVLSEATAPIPASAVLAVGVDLMTDPVSQRGHFSTKALRSALGVRQLERTTKPDLSERADVLATAVPTDRDLRLIATNSQI